LQGSYLSTFVAGLKAIRQSAEVAPGKRGEPEPDGEHLRRPPLGHIEIDTPFDRPGKGGIWAEALSQAK
jgi:hypothetical protein